MDLSRKIESESKLAQLFNKVLEMHQTQMTMFGPYYECMSSFMQKTNGNDSKVAETISQGKEIYYRTLVLENSLHGIHMSICVSIKLLKRYLNKYGADWENYAMSNRLQTIEKYGGEDYDYDEVGNVLSKTGIEALKEFTIKSELSNYIGASFKDEINPGEVRGEGIGTSTIHDFSLIILTIENQTDFSIFKFFRKISDKPLPIYQKDENGNFRELNLADEVETEMNEDINNFRIALLFGFVIAFCSHIRTKFESIPYDQDAKIEYQILLKMLKCTLNLDVKLPK